MDDYPLLGEIDLNDLSAGALDRQIEAFKATCRRQLTVKF